MKKPNILILLPDQQRHDTIHAAGADFMKTPNTDRLVNEGCVFKNTYSPNPVCMPARHYLLTGVSAKHHGYYENSNNPIADEGIPTIPRVLSDNGYNTVAIGKMHFHPPRRHHGFDEMHLMEEIPPQVLDDAYLKFLKVKGFEDLRNIHGIRPGAYHTPQKALMPEKFHGVNWVADKSSEWIKENGHSPFFMMCGWIKPHPPWNIPEEWANTYKNTELPEPSSPESRELPFPTGYNELYGDNDSAEARRKIREAYYTSISMVDNAVGKVLDTLEQEGLIDNTIIIYTSDHGEMLQDKGLYSKELPFESSARVPFIVRYPEKFRPGTSNENFTDLMDILPTILELSGIDYNYKEKHLAYRLEGHSLVSGKKRKYAYSEFGTGKIRWAMVRDEKFKYAYFYNGGREFFYDLDKDPKELNNLAKSPRAPMADLQRLRKKCVEMEKIRAPEGHVAGDHLKAFSAEKISKFSASKYPLWSNQQFQKFGTEKAPRETSLFIEEINGALGMTEKEYMDSMPNDAEYREEFAKNFRNIKS